MKIAIHQPEHMPWAGFFHKMAKADVYVILDCVQYSKNNWQNRNRFITPKNNLFWLTVPVKAKGRLGKTIRETEIAYSTRWVDKYWETLKMNYIKTDFFSDYATEIKSILDTSFVYLWELNLALIQLIRKHLKIDTKMIFASELNPRGNKTELLVDICKKVGATRYISGQGAKQYLDLSLFAEEKIHIEFDEFNPFDTACNLSILHSLFTLGPQIRSCITAKNNTKQ